MFFNKEVILNSPIIGWGRKHKTGIITTIEVAGVISTVILASKETTKMEQLKNNGEIPEDTKGKIKTYTFLYWPSALCGVATCGLIAYTNFKGAKHAAALSNALMLSNTAYTRLQDAMKASIGEKKTNAIQGTADKAEIEEVNHEWTNLERVGSGNTLFRIAWNGREFVSSQQAVEDAFNQYNGLLNSDGVASLNDLYSFLKIRTTEEGQFLGHMANSRHDLLSYNNDRLYFDCEVLHDSPFDQITIIHFDMPSDVSNML